MKRTTILLTDDLVTLVEAERRRRDVSAAEIIREAVAGYFKIDPSAPRRYSFIGLGRSGRDDLAGRIDELLAEGWGGDRGRR